MPSFSRDATALLADSLLPELSWRLDDDPRQGVLHRGALRVVAATLLDLLETRAECRRASDLDIDQIREGAERALALAAAANAGLLSSDGAIAAAGLLAYANALLRACEEHGIGWELLSQSVVGELNRQLGEFLDGRREVPAG